MIVNNTTVNRGSLDCSDLQNKTIGARNGDLGYELPELGRFCVDGGSEPGEGTGRGSKKVHIQVMKIMEEESLVAEGLEKIGGRNRHVASTVFFFSRPILPCSPLSGKASRRQGIALN